MYFCLFVCLSCMFLDFVSLLFFFFACLFVFVCGGGLIRFSLRIKLSADYISYYEKKI